MLNINLMHGLVEKLPYFMFFTKMISSYFHWSFLNLAVN
jgi:hypothetical protein